MTFIIFLSSVLTSTKEPSVIWIPFSVSVWMFPVLTEAFPFRIGLKKSPPGAKQNLCFQTLYGGVKFSSNSSLHVKFVK